MNKHATTMVKDDLLAYNKSMHQNGQRSHTSKNTRLKTQQYNRRMNTQCNKVSWIPLPQ